MKFPHRTATSHRPRRDPCPVLEVEVNLGYASRPKTAPLAPALIASQGFYLLQPPSTRRAPPLPVPGWQKLPARPINRTAWPPPFWRRQLVGLIVGEQLPARPLGLGAALSRGCHRTRDK